ncbi:MAG: hypothetical protein AAFR45_01185 [Pseudomonadota bacterium]
MSDLTVTKLRMRNGIWEGMVTGGSAANANPAIRVTYLDEPHEGVELTAGKEDGTWLLRIPVPASAVSEGVHTFLIRDAASDEKLADFTLIAGEVATDDLRGELELLRAELDMLKRAFRRHCVETLSS